jgi:hypothetical protein
LPSAPGYGTRKMIETVIWTKWVFRSTKPVKISFTFSHLYLTSCGIKETQEISLTNISGVFCAGKQQLGCVSYAVDTEFQKVANITKN